MKISDIERKLSGLSVFCVETSADRAEMAKAYALLALAKVLDRAVSLIEDQGDEDE